jgi:hypothetical protein
MIQDKRTVESIIIRFNRLCKQYGTDRVLSVSRAVSAVKTADANRVRSPKKLS